MRGERQRKAQRERERDRERERERERERVVYDWPTLMQTIEQISITACLAKYFGPLRKPSIYQ